MKQEEVFKKIGGIIKELSDQYEYLETVTGKLNDLELELFVSNAHFLTDHIEILSKLNLQVSDPLPIIQTEERKYFEPVVQQIRHEGAPEEIAKASKPVEIEITNFRPDDDEPIQQIDLSAETPEETFSLIREEPETIRHELILDDTHDWDEDENIETAEYVEPSAEETDAPHVEEQPVIPIDNKDTETKVIEPRKEPANEKKAEDILTINQKISSQMGDKAVGRTEQISASPISDIKEAITLNDKLLFVKDLFNGYSLAYAEAIEILNRFTSFEEASRFLNTNYVTKNNWQSKPGTTEKFYALLRRRYA